MTLRGPPLDVKSIFCFVPMSAICIELASVHDHHIAKQVQWPADDYVLHMVVRQGPMISRPKEKAYVRVYDLGQNPDGHLRVFKMSILEASLLSETYPEFESSGLVGEFHLRASTGLLSLKSVFVNRNDPEATKEFLLATSSHPFVRTSYDTLLR